MPEEDKEVREEIYSFDELAIGLASGAISRGQALKLVGGAILGAVLGGAGLAWATDDAEARRRRRRKCPPGTVRVSRRKRGRRRRIVCLRIVSTITCNNNNQCPAGSTCQNGVCVITTGCQNDNQCPAGSTCQNGVCVSPGPCTVDTDCPSGFVCQNGVCVATTPVCPVNVPSGCALGPPACACPSGTTCIGSGTSGKCK